MAARQHQYHHHVKAPNRPTWLAMGAAPPPAPSRDGEAKELAAPAFSAPFLLSPTVWRKAQQNGKAGPAGGRDHPGRRRGDVPASPRISCMGQVKGGRRCSSVRGRGTAARGSGSKSCYAGEVLTGLVMELFGGRRRGSKSRAYSKVRDVPSDSSSSSGSSDRGARAPAAARPFDPPLPVPVVRRPAKGDDAPSLWERRRSGGKALEALQLM